VQVMPRISSADAGPSAPIRVGVRPRSWLISLVTVLGGVACSQTSNNQVTGPIDLGMTSTIAAYYNAEELTLYEVQTPVPLPVRKPSGSELSALGPAPANTGYPTYPWLLASDESLEVHFTISNIDNQDHAVWLLIDPWNEFVRWNPGVSVVDDEDAEPNWGYDQSFLVPAMSRVEGTITTDDMQEIAIKLASVENLLNSSQAKSAEAEGGGVVDAGGGDTEISGFDPNATANNIFNPQNRSNGNDPLYTPWIPPVIAGLTGFDLGLRTTETANVAVEITINVQDLNGNRFVPANSNQPEIGLPPVTLSPPGATM
jgi:hypothetical protein